MCNWIFGSQLFKDDEDSRHAFFICLEKLCVFVPWRSSCEYRRILSISCRSFDFYQTQSGPRERDPAAGPTGALEVEGQRGDFSVSRWGCAELTPPPRVSANLPHWEREGHNHSTSKKQKTRKKSACEINDSIKHSKNILKGAWYNEARTEEIMPLN